jgi:hypothetical protein
MSCFGSSGGAEAAACKTCHPVPVHSTCFELYRMRTDRHWLHQKLVAFARVNGLWRVIDPAATSPERYYRVMMP